MVAKPFYAAVTGMPPTKAPHLAVAFGATVKFRINENEGRIWAKRYWQPEMEK